MNITASEGANDALGINGGGGNDRISASTLSRRRDHPPHPRRRPPTTITLIGSQGADPLSLAVTAMTPWSAVAATMWRCWPGAGDDVFRWNPGNAGNDIVEGQDGADRLDFDGANIAENIDIFGQRRTTVASPATSPTSRWISTTSSGIDFHALGGADNVVIDDPRHSDLPLAGVAVDLAGSVGRRRRGGGHASRSTARPATTIIIGTLRTRASSA